MTDREKEIYEREADIQHAFLMGFLASNSYYNGEAYCYDKKKVLQSGEYQKALAVFLKGFK